MSHDYGPQPTRGAPFRRRMRFHQSWYRAHVLDVPCGVGPKRRNKSRLGNMLMDQDGQLGKNFLTPHIFEVVKRRIALERSGVDEFHLCNDLLSDQAMLYNLFGPLVDDLGRARQALEALLPGEIGYVRRVWLAFAPQPVGDYLNDHTAFDIYIYYTLPDRTLAFLGINATLSLDSGAKAVATPRYWEWTRRADSPWTETSWPSLLEQPYNVLWRSHLLAVALKGASPLGFSAGRFIFLYHPQDETAHQAVSAYRAALKLDQESFKALSLGDVAAAWTGLGDWVAEFSQRYLELDRSQDVYVNLR